MAGPIKTVTALSVGAMKYAEFRKTWEEGSAEKARRSLLDEIEKQIPHMRDSLDLVNDSTILKNEIKTIAALEQLNLSHHTAANLDKMADSITTNTAQITGKIDEAASCINEMTLNSTGIAKDIHGVRIIGNSMLDSMEYHMKFMQTAAVGLAFEVHQGVQALKKIGESLDGINKAMIDRNSIYTQGSAGEDGFATHVYDYIETSIEATTKDSSADNHRYFVYHPDTNWYPAFHRLIRNNPLPGGFCAKSDDLDQLCLIMQTARRTLVEASDAGKDINFHLLIPAWSPISITEPLHFPDDLQPFRVEGLKYQGKPYVTFNLPFERARLLYGIRNLRDPEGWNTLSNVGASTTWLVGGTVLNTACLALGLCAGVATGLGTVIVVPIWGGGFFGTATTIALPATYAVRDALHERPPRILGSNERKKAL
ncbi:uncharacterized protein TRUGW13939_05974 [Talaromyces rugulosus]|uniref:Uncharacterized protein n=1 Tax=Talaromyces rugulosus TaxID=121627 RepID=A0A7H8QYJ6_TALRU|nr:uncharacterized protein TRUGW13939_05974 [Talaromyces rugulosus]QKX58846.1 hypothetical protein TRUGW13939_05974 [Talaromyces rugulosus]